MPQRNGSVTHLLVHHAGREWCCEVIPGEAAREIATWLGEWVRVTPGTGNSPKCVGRIKMSVSGELPERQPGITAGTSATMAVLGNCTVTIAHNHADMNAEVAFHPGSAAPSLVSVLRLLSLQSVFSEGGLALHASSVRMGDGVLLFVGPAGVGKTTAAQVFPPGDRLDDDLVFLTGHGGKWVRPATFDTRSPARFGPEEVGELEVRAIILPYAAASFEAEPLGSAEALAACLHMPPPGLLVPGDSGSNIAARVLANTSRMVAEVKVVRVGWSVDQDLPSLLRVLLDDQDAVRR